MNFSEKSYVNRTAILGHSLISAVLIIAYMLEMFKGSRTPAYFAVFAVLCATPIAIEFFVFSKDKESSLIKHVVCIGYSILYTFAIFTTTSLLTCTYAFPMFMVVILYMDTRCCALIAGGASLGNAIYIVYHYFTVGYSASELPDVEIRMACVLLTGIFMVLSCKAVTKVNDEKLKQIYQQSNAAKSLTENILNSSGKMISDISDAAEKVHSLGESVSHIHNSMNEVSTGSTETAESVQRQLQRTEQIQEYIVQVKQAAAQIEEQMTKTTQRVGEGQAQMVSLADQVEKSMNANEQMLEQMKSLNEYTGQMNTIIEMITSITNSTGMLALNASIEAARAGEAGRGFAVVAKQISDLANQTKDATANITQLIENIDKELLSVEDAVEVVTDCNRTNSENTQAVTDNFSKINQGTSNVSRQTQELLASVNELESANADIVENIQTISAITQEVSAHAGETYNACEENASHVSAVTRIVENLNEEAQKLQKTEMNI